MTIDKILYFFKKKIIPKSVFDFFQPVYHYFLAFLSALIYGFPSKELTIIGVTGTKGKTTTCYLIAQILETAGFRVGMLTTVLFKICEKEWINNTKQTMLGRFQLQKFLRQMVKSGCQYAIIETSSEGILQYRHKFIDYEVAIFTNLSPEHIERHKSFENYRKEKIKLFEKVSKKENSIGIYNLDDENIRYFFEPKINNQYIYTLKLKKQIAGIKNLYKITNTKISNTGTSFLFNNEEFKMPLIGEFNIYNAGAAICLALSQKIKIEQIKKALTQAKAPPGRLEIIKNNCQDFTIIIDYAHEPASLEAVYKTIKKAFIRNQKSKIICLLGSQGGGRDKWKRPKMGEIAGKYCDKIILTNEDPYDEPPIEILNQIEKGIRANSSLYSEISHLSVSISPRKSISIYKIIDRKEAIKKAISLAQKNDVVILTGKAGETWMCIENNKKIPWNERKIIETILSENPKIKKV